MSTCKVCGSETEDGHAHTVSGEFLTDRAIEIAQLLAENDRLKKVFEELLSQASFSRNCGCNPCYGHPERDAVLDWVTDTIHEATRKVARRDFEQLSANLDEAVRHIECLLKFYGWRSIPGRAAHVFLTKQKGEEFCNHNWRKVINDTAMWVCSKCYLAHEGEPK